MGNSRKSNESSANTAGSVSANANYTVPVQSDDEGEIVAAITAAIYAYGITNNTSYEIKSITEKSSQKKISAQRHNAWAEAGRISNTSGF
jgi:hypothetical protein